MPETNRSSPDFLKSLNSFAQKKHETFWLATRFLEKSARLRALCILSLDGEFYRIVSTVNEEIVAQIRLQWWRDEIERLSAGEEAQLTLPAQALAYLIESQPELKEQITALIDSYDDVASGQGGDYARRLFALLFLANGCPKEAAERLSGVCGAIFQSANTGAINQEALRGLCRELDTLPDAAWPFVSLFEFGPDWVKKQRPGALMRRWRMLKSFLGGEPRLKTKLAAMLDQALSSS